MLRGHHDPEQFDMLMVNLPKNSNPEPVEGQEVRTSLLALYQPQFASIDRFD